MVERLEWSWCKDYCHLKLPPGSALVDPGVEPTESLTSNRENLTNELNINLESFSDLRFRRKFSFNL